MRCLTLRNIADALAILASAEQAPSARSSEAGAGMESARVRDTRISGDSYRKLLRAVAETARSSWGKRPDATFESKGIKTTRRRSAGIDGEEPATVCSQGKQVSPANLSSDHRDPLRHCTA